MQVPEGRSRVQARRPPWFLTPRRPSVVARAPAVALRTIRVVAGVARGSLQLRRRMPRTAAIKARVPARRQRRAPPGTSRPYDLLRKDDERRRDDGGHSIQRRVGGARLW